MQSHWCEPACSEGVLALRVEVRPMANAPPASVSLNFSTSTCASALSYVLRTSPQCILLSGTPHL